MKRKIICIILIILVLQYFSNFVFAENSLTNTITNEIVNGVNDNQTQELQEQKEEVDKKLNETNEKLEYVKEELSSTMLKVQETEDKVLEYQKQVNELGVQIQELQTSIDEASKNLEIASQDYNAKSDMLAERLVAMYEAGDTSYLDVLLKSSSLTDFLSRYYAIEELTKYDSELIERVKNEKNNIEQTRQKLENEQAEIRIIKAKNEQATIVLNNMKTLQQSYMDKLSEGEKKLQEQITEYKKEQEEIQAKILEATNVIVPNIQYTGGEMLWPVAASGTVITSNFGMREHPIQGIVKQHTGLDIGGAETGTPIVAAADGIVTYAGWLGGYGNCVMISHGNGVVTLYGHGNKVLTTVGKEVKQGETIMELGSTGNSTGPHCHFEVRVNGSYTNPLNYVKKP